MRRPSALLACGALFSGAVTMGLLAGPASGGQQVPAAVLTVDAVFTCTDESITVDWTLTVSSEDGLVTDIEFADASPDFGDVTFTPATGLEDGDTATGSSTHAPDTTEVVLDVEWITVVVGGPTAIGDLVLTLPVDCPTEGPPGGTPGDPPPVVAPVVEPTFAG